MSEIKFYFVYEIRTEEIQPVAMDVSSDTRPVKFTHKRFSVPYTIPLQGKLGSGYMFTLPEPGARVREIGIMMPDLDGILESERLKGQQEIINKIKTMSFEDIYNEYVAEPQYEDDYDL